MTQFSDSEAIHANVELSTLPGCDTHVSNGHTHRGTHRTEAPMVHCTTHSEPARYRP